MRVSVIVSTYNSPDSLLKTLYSLDCQSYRDFEVLVADDGSGPETAAAIRRAQCQTRLTISHLWQEDCGFRKNTILNRSLIASRGDYLVFLDGDCIGRRDLIATHVRSARPNRVLTCGSQIDLPAAVHAALDYEAIAEGRPFQWSWLESHGVRLASSRLTDKPFRLGCPLWLGRVMDLCCRRSAGFVGCNSSAWKRDVLRVNGFDESIAYGVDDKDLGIRLMNAGVRARRLKYSLVYVHLAHPRAYADPGLIERNKRLVRQRRSERVTWVTTGIEKRSRAA